MRSRIRHVSYILDFLGVGFDPDEISKTLGSEADVIIRSLNCDGLEDWELQFRATYGNGKYLLISKNRIGTYPSDKYKEITIPIPIPSNAVVPWGVMPQQHIYDPNHYDALLKNFNILEVNAQAFVNRNDYIIDCLRRAIHYSFEHGITIKGKKLIAKSSK